MQFLCRDGFTPHVLPCWDLFKYEQYIYLTMPYCSSGELFTHVERHGRFEEGIGRFWFRQLLAALFHLQKYGVSHRDISLENILVDKNTEALVIDLGMCIRLPYNSSDGSNELCNSFDGSLRKMVYPAGQCGKPNYISPEILRNEEPFDGFAVDLWSAGIGEWMKHP